MISRYYLLGLFAISFAAGSIFAEASKQTNKSTAEIKAEITGETEKIKQPVQDSIHDFKSNENIAKSLMILTQYEKMPEL
jgi:hypothetical protein